LLVKKMGEKITDFEGNAITDPDGTELTLRDVCIRALLMNHPDERNIKGEEKLRRYDLALKIQNQKTPELTTTEISNIKDLIGRAFAALIVGRAWHMLEGDE